VLRGRPINPLVAIIPAGFVALLLPGSSGMLLRLHIHRALNANSGEGSGLLGLIVAPMNLWLFWGFALAAATLAYWLRRRPDCPTCNRGVEPMRGVWRRQDPPAGGDS
jgi:phosphotransferase system  glucose/maltose/N-acetylglucosamine-specific IIC component